MLFLKAEYKRLLKMLKWLEVCCCVLNLCATKKNPVSINVFRRRVELTTLERFEVMVKFCDDVENYKYT